MHDEGGNNNNKWNELKLKENMKRSGVDARFTVWYGLLWWHNAKLLKIDVIALNNESKLDDQRTTNHSDTRVGRVKWVPYECMCVKCSLCYGILALCLSVVLVASFILFNVIMAVALCACVSVFVVVFVAVAVVVIRLCVCGSFEIVRFINVLTTRNTFKPPSIMSCREWVCECV